jgi:hypothetical protein
MSQLILVTDQATEGQSISTTLTPAASIADLAAITGGEAPTEAEYNLIVTKVNAILDVLDTHGLTA